LFHIILSLSYICILQRSVVTPMLRRGEIFDNHVIVNSTQSKPVKQTIKINLYLAKIHVDVWQHVF